MMLACGLAGCETRASQTLDPRITISRDAGVVLSAPLAVSVNSTGITRVSIELRNTLRRDLAINCTSDWFDENQHPTTGIASVPTRVALPSLGTEFCETVSPSPAARNFRVAVTPAY